MGQRRSGWSIEIGTISQIPIRIHVTFLLLLVWLVLGSEAASPIMEGLFVCVIFACVLLHELGHALTAKRFGVATKDITLYPFGGIASITSQPSAKAELVIALAGPLVNVCIAAAIYPWITLPELSEPNTTAVSLSFGTRVFITNVALAVFNLLPALPMDGGRVLRAILALMNLKHATMIAARVSQVLCVLLAILALFVQQPMLFLISLIIFFGAMQEHVRAESKLVAIGLKASEAMVRRERLESFSHGTTISKALHTAITSLQPLFPVMNGEQFLGVVFREDLLEHAATRADDYVGEIMTRSLASVDENSPLSDALTMFEQSGSGVVVVKRDEQYSGLLVYDRLADFLLLHEIRQNLPKDDETEWPTPL